MYIKRNEDWSESDGLCQQSKYVQAWYRKYKERGRRNIRIMGSGVPSMAELICGLRQWQIKNVIT